MDVNCGYNAMIYNDFMKLEFLPKLKPLGQPSGFFWPYYHKGGRRTRPGNHLWIFPPTRSDKIK
jgi:hypothetical protein